MWRWQTLVMSSSLVLRSAELGILVEASQVLLERTRVHATGPGLDGGFGRGVEIQVDEPGEHRGGGSVRSCVISESTDIGILIIGTDVVVDSTLVSAAAAVSSNGLGDGLTITGYPAVAAASVEVTASRIEHSPRAGISSFGALVRARANEIECNAIDLDGEALDVEAVFEHLGDNRCGCDGLSTECRVISSSLSPPQAL